MSSIRQSPLGNGLPDFRNHGVILRLLLGVNLIGVGAALVLAPDVGHWLDSFLEVSYRLQPPLLVSITVLAALARPLRRLPSGVAPATVVALVVAVVLLAEDLLRFVGLSAGGVSAHARAALLAVLATAMMLMYFALRERAADPAANAARVAALTARIRPHFLFNSLNAVLSLIRSDPRRAEDALESLAELFRVLMRDARDLAPLSREIQLCRQYLDLEKLRLGDRLRVEWQIADVPDDALVPPLMLQPLIENAVYHGIEPAEAGGTLRIAFARRDRDLVVEITNPVAGDGAHRAGNRMALANIRERLALHFDLEASLETQECADTFRVTIRLPLDR